ncbi:hypothetical protein BaRGS_00017457, partial [Batillaria attramentaria]
MMFPDLRAQASEHTKHAASVTKVTHKNLMAVEGVGLLFAFLHVAENTLMVFSMKDAKKMVKPMRILVVHLGVVYTLYGFFSINASAVNLITYKDTNLGLCYLRTSSMSLLEKVATYGTMWMVICCIVMRQPTGAMYDVFTSGRKLNILLALTWLFASIGTAITFSVDTGEWGEVCELLRGYSREAEAIMEGVGMVVMIAGLLVLFWRSVRGSRPVSPDSFLLEESDGTYHRHDEITLTVVSTIFTVMALPKLVFDITYVMTGRDETLTDDEYYWHVAADVIWRLSGIFLFPVMLCRHSEARRHLKKTLCKKLQMGRELSLQVDDTYRRNTVCRLALQ